MSKSTSPAPSAEEGTLSAPASRPVAIPRDLKRKLCALASIGPLPQSKRLTVREREQLPPFTQRLAVALERSTSAWSPQPRLVGIELNPGPPKRLRGTGAMGLAADIGEAGYALAHLINGDPQKKTARTKVKRKKKSGGAVTARIMSSQISTRSNRPAVSQVPTIRNKQDLNTVRLPFDVCSLLVSSNTSDINPVFGPIGGGAYGVQFDPNNLISSNPVFGAISTVAGSFRRYRFSGLQAEYLPLVGSNTGGAVAFVAIEDGAVPLTAALSWAQVTSSDRSVSTPVWQRTAVDLSHISKDWFYVHDPTTSESSSTRLDNAGVILIAGIGLSTSTYYGSFRIRGVLELADLTATFAVMPNAFAPGASASSSSSSLPSSLLPSNHTHPGTPRPASPDVDTSLEESIHLDRSLARSLRYQLGLQSGH